MYVLDSNTLIYHFRGVERVTNRMNAVPFNQIAIPTVVLYELYVGLAKAQNATKRAELLDCFTAEALILPFNKKTAYCAAQVRAQLEKKGQPIGPIDVLVAGSAIATQATLVTHNTREFSKVEGLVIEDWYL